MSAKYMGLVWEVELPHSEAWVLMAMADHADHNGDNVFPSMGYIAWKTGYDERSVRRIVARLRKKEILIPVRQWIGHAKHYRIDFSKVPFKKPYEGQKCRRVNASEAAGDDEYAFNFDP